MKITKKRSLFHKLDDDFMEQDFDIYHEDFDEEEAFDRGMEAWEIGFSKGFSRGRLRF
jgi:hypothetical protein